MIKSGIIFNIFSFITFLCSGSSPNSPSGIFKKVGFEKKIFENAISKLLGVKVTTKNLQELDEKIDLKSVTLCSLDIDGIDYYVWEALKYKPIICVIKFNMWVDPELSIAITARRIDLLEELEILYNSEFNNNSLTKHFPSAVIVINGLIEKLLKVQPAVEVEDYIRLELKKSRLDLESYVSGPNNSLIEIFNRKTKKNLDNSSTGEQKLLLISIILSHARLLNNKFNMAPILLLDDIVEHLDKKHRRALFLEVSRHNAQSWFTSTSKEAFLEYPSFIEKINLQKIKENFNGNYHFRYGDI